ncbi:hypothetical protein [Actinoplanes sp. NPDC049316]|uniref:hypothetical protein n=1 Tax=Actinoplanes sp. NPDC049316 TaxID=3154727 RepID=UPI003418FC96
MLPWFRTRFAVNDSWAGHTATAWAASTWWSVAVLMCVVAAALGVAGAARQPSVPHAIARWSATALAGAATILTAIVRASIPSLEDQRGDLGWSAADPSSPDVGDIVRDHLVLVDHDGLTQQVTWGYHAGLASMALLTVALAIGAAGLADRSPRAPNDSSN